MSEHEDIDLRQASRAEPPPRARSAAVLGGIFVLVLIAVFGARVFAPRSARVPAALGGFRLGESRDESERRAGVAAVRASAGPSAGAALEARTSVFDVPATCRLRFEADVLSEVDCRLDAAPDRERATVRLRGLLATLRKLLGDESASGRVAGVDRWEWRNTKAFLALESAAEGGETRVVSGHGAPP